MEPNNCLFTSESPFVKSAILLILTTSSQNSLNVESLERQLPISTRIPLQANSFSSFTCLNFCLKLSETPQSPSVTKIISAFLNVESLIKSRAFLNGASKFVPPSKNSSQIVITFSGDTSPFLITIGSFA